MEITKGSLKAKEFPRAIYGEKSYNNALNDRWINFLDEFLGDLLKREKTIEMSEMILGEVFTSIPEDSSVDTF